MEKKTIGFIGGGRIVRILLEGFKKVPRQRYCFLPFIHQ